MSAVVECDRVICVAGDVDAAYGGAVIIKVYRAVAVDEEFFVFRQERGGCGEVEAVVYVEVDCEGVGRV